jgi:hypothetical protein
MACGTKFKSKEAKRKYEAYKHINLKKKEKKRKVKK